MFSRLSSSIELIHLHSRVETLILDRLPFEGIIGLCNYLKRNVIEVFELKLYEKYLIMATGVLID